MCKYTYHHYPTCGHISSFTLEACIEITNALRSATPLAGHEVLSTHNLLPATQVVYCLQCEADWIHSLSPAPSNAPNRDQQPNTLETSLPYISLEGLDAVDPIITAEVTMTLPCGLDAGILYRIPGGAVMGGMQRDGAGDVVVPGEVLHDSGSRLEEWMEDLDEYEMSGFRGLHGEEFFSSDSSESSVSSTSSTPGRAHLHSPFGGSSEGSEGESGSTDSAGDGDDELSAEDDVMETEQGDNGEFYGDLQILFPGLFNSSTNAFWERRSI